jgi:hypothetical protein
MHSITGNGNGKRGSRLGVLRAIMHVLSADGSMSDGFPCLTLLYYLLSGAKRVSNEVVNMHRAKGSLIIQSSISQLAKNQYVVKLIKLHISIDICHAQNSHNGRFNLLGM